MITGRPAFKYIALTLLQISAAFFAVFPLPVSIFAYILSDTLGVVLGLVFFVICWFLSVAVFIVKQSGIVCLFGEKYISRYIFCSMAGFVIAAIALVIFNIANRDDGKLAYSIPLYSYLPSLALLLFPVKNKSRIPGHLKKAAGTSFLVFLVLTALLASAAVCVWVSDYVKIDIMDWLFPLYLYIGIIATWPLILCYLRNRKPYKRGTGEISQPETTP